MHTPVLMAPVLEALRVEPGGIYVDCTFGRGGHTRAILARLSPGGRMIALDRDPAALSASFELRADSRLELVQARFSALGDLIAARALRGKLNGVLMDLGVSSPQLDDPDRGFSFRADGPLDMRMDPTAGESAAAWLNRAPEADIQACLRDYGEERHARRIAARICEQRLKRPFRTTRELVEVVTAVVPRGAGRINPATRTFQALRIHINDELAEIATALPAAAEALAPAGRLVVISFHSLEDRIVKRYFRNSASPPERNGRAAAARFRLVQRKPIMADEGEIAINPRARSARLRVLERGA